jgi:hypothetical protein
MEETGQPVEEDGHAGREPLPHEHYRPGDSEFPPRSFADSQVAIHDQFGRREHPKRPFSAKIPELSTQRARAPI